MAEIPPLWKHWRTPIDYIAGEGRGSCRGLRVRRQRSHNATSYVRHTFDVSTGPPHTHPASNILLLTFQGFKEIVISVRIEPVLTTSRGLVGRLNNIGGPLGKVGSVKGRLRPPTHSTLTVYIDFHHVRVGLSPLPPMHLELLRQGSGGPMSQVGTEEGALLL